MTPTTLYAGTSSDGVFKSTNGGSSWSAINTGLGNRDIQDLVIDPTMSNTIYAATYNSGVFKSSNGGNNWISIHS